MAETQMPADEPRAHIRPPAPGAQSKETPKAASGKSAQPTQQAGSEDVPARPELAPNVELSGEMQEGGFSESQWLVQRDGRFIQVTELLYRLAENIDGQRNLDEIATAVSEAYGKTVSAENVRQLIAKQLIPKGLVVKADGTVVGPAEGKGDARSPLAVNMRMAMISPRLIRPVTAILKYLFQPLVLVTVLVVAIGAQVWLYMAHGLAQSTRAAMYTPGLMLALMAVIVLSAAFHEFGHASALEYGGGKVRGMGAGLYIIYPAFYTDVTDNYRLGRWARIRTDLGGFYFNLIFALGVIGVFLLTGQEWLLLAVLFLDMDIIRQTLPIVRLDGYWALADLTGIPDFFSQIPAFLRTVLPLPWWKGPKLPNLKRWVKVVFALYILITIPLLVFLLFLLIKSVPRVLATAWDSFWKQSATFGQARTSGDVLLMLATSVQMLLLALPAFGTLFIIYSLGRRILTALWNWSKPTPLRRIIGGVGTVVAVALLVLLWMPRLPFSNDLPNPVYAVARPQFKPIEPQERGTIHDVVRPIAFAVSGDLPSTAPVTSTAEATTPTPDARTPTADALTSTPPVTAADTATTVPDLTATATPGAATRTATSGITATIAVAASPTVALTSSPVITPTVPAATSSPTGVAATATVAASSPTRPAATATVAMPTRTPGPPTATARPAATATTRPAGATSTPLPAATATSETPPTATQAVATATQAVAPAVEATPTTPAAADATVAPEAATAAPEAATVAPEAVTAVEATPVP